MFELDVSLNVGSLYRHCAIQVVKPKGQKKKLRLTTPEIDAIPWVVTNLRDIINTQIPGEGDRPAVLLKGTTLPRIMVAIAMTLRDCGFNDIRLEDDKGNQISV
ncbi:MAG TPA: hypothetical protein VIR98_03245 [Candidatus Paceibacterota bacterium]|jgi:hypothetical protein